MNEVKLLGKLPEEINDLSDLSIDLGITEWELSHICYMINLKYNIRFSIEDIIGIRTLGELTDYYYKLINKEQ